MLKKLAEFVARYCYVVFAVFLVLAVVCGLLSTKVKINHDIYSYMPEDSETTKGLAIMNDEFDYSSTSGWQIMFEDLKEGETEEIREYIEGVKNIKDVAHDDTEDFNRKVGEHSYSLFLVTVDAPADSAEANAAYAEIFNHFDGRYTFYENGDVFLNNGAVIQPMIVILAIACAMVILTLMSASFVEPWLYLFAIMIAVLLNKGTNIIFPSVSHVTDGISMVLQMALSMDYAIMLSSRYRQEKEKLIHEPGERRAKNRLAMQRALRYSFGAISSSSVTTVVGLIVLVFMSFTIGRDMGLVLSKGVVLSLISIFTTLPALLLLSDRLVEKLHKKTLPLKMDWFGKQSAKLRHVALPIFILIFGAAFLLKGNVNILFTASENNKIKDVFPENNQTALIYQNSEEKRAAELCNKFEKRDEVVQILCYSNTIGEKEKYDEIVPKANKLNSTKVSGKTAGDGSTIDTEDYLIKAIYYYYFRGDKHTMSLPELVTFIQNEVIPDERFAGEVSARTVRDIDRFSNFVISEKMNRPRTKAEMAELLEVDSSLLDELYTLYLAEHPTGVKLTLYQFAYFVTNEVLTNPEYASMIGPSERADLAKLLLFSNPNVTNRKQNAAELAQLFGLNKDDVEKLLLYYNYVNIENPTIAVKPEDLLNYALDSETIRAEIDITTDDADKIKNEIAKVRADAEKYETELSARLDEALSNSSLSDETKAKLRTIIDERVGEIKGKVSDVLTAEYSYADYAALAAKVESLANDIKTKASEIEQALRAKVEELNETYDLNIVLPDLALPEVKLDSYLEKLKQIYRLYQAERTNTQLTPTEFIEFLLAHKNDERLSGELTGDKLRLLELANYVVHNQSTRYGYMDLAATFDLDAEKLKLVYALYDSRHVTTELMLSPKAVLDFLVESVLPNEQYASRLSEDSRVKISTVHGLMRAAIAGTQYDYSALYRALSPLSDKLDRNQIFLVYLYHGSLYDYDENWALSIEQFVAFLNDSILPDSRFDGRIDEETREKIVDAKDRVADARDMLVGEKHSRALIETHLPAEGAETFAFLQSIKDEMGEGNKTQYYVIGDSAMAYEMSQSFGNEMDFITILTMISIFIVVALTFKSILIPLILVLVIQSAVYLNTAYLSLTGQSIYFIAMIIVQAILMGATIDYAILFTSYYLEHRRYFKQDIKDALISAYNKSIHSILTSASILIIVTAIVGNFATAIAAKICQSISGGTFAASLIILLLLPAMLAALDRWIIREHKD